MTVIYGISNCDAIKKTKCWLEENQLNYSFHDYRQQGIDKKTLKRWLSQQDENVLLNKRSTTWKQLSEREKSYATQNQLIQLFMDYPTLIKRPVIEQDKQIICVGYNENNFQTLRT